MKSAKCLWLSKSCAETQDEFLKKYAVGIPENPCFSSIEFDTSISISVKAERYGGAGGGKHGGGARCANINGLQVKGVGLNCLEGCDNPPWYSSGALNLADAVHEAIYSDVLGKTLPLGTVKIEGVILTGADTAFTRTHASSQKLIACPGALLVRETCVRPAHFLRSRYYVPVEKYRHKIQGDVARVRAVHKELASHFGGEEAFISEAIAFLENCANQFAFAQVARIAHMATSPSNIAMDGKWLDLQSASFLEGGVNYVKVPDEFSFLKEYTVAEKTAFQFILTFTKFNEVTLDPLPLMAKFKLSMKRHFHKHCAYLFGIPQNLWPKVGEQEECDTLVRIVHQLIHYNTTVVIGLPHTINSLDPVIGTIEALFISITDIERAKRLLAEKIDGRFSPTVIIGAFTPVMENITRKISSDKNDNRAFLTRCALIALKKAYCSAYYYRGRINKQLERMSASAQPENYRTLIEDSINIADWVFAENEGDRITLFNTDQILLNYDSRRNFYHVIESNPKSARRFQGYFEFVAAINQLEPSLLIIQEYNFKHYLNQIGGVIQSLEAFDETFETEAEGLA